MFASIFTTLIVKPLFNLLTFIYAIFPGHNFGFSIILFTIIIRLLLWPLVKKQLHQARTIRKLQPELKKIKLQTKGNRQLESKMVMELYKERGVNPFGSIFILLLQLPILFGLYAGLHKIIVDPHNLVTFSYPFIQHLSWMKHLATDIKAYDHSLFGAVDLTRAALNKGGGIYWPAMVIVLGSAISQFFQSKQLMPTDQNARKLRHILKDASSSGAQADQSEVNAAVGRSTRFLIPVMIFFFTVNIASALSLYWLVSGVVAVLQQAYILRQDEEELEVVADKPSPIKLTKIEKARLRAKKAPEAEVVITYKSQSKSSGSAKANTPSGKKAKRRNKS